jgi:NuA3 HAT complex component NTO1
MYYTSVQTFELDLAKVLSSEAAPPLIVEDEGEAEAALDKVPHNTLTPEQKDTKKLVKRITKGLQLHFEEASRREAELAGRPYEELPDLETLLNQKLRRQPSLLDPQESIRQTTETEQPIAEQDAAHPDGEAEAVAAKPEEMQLAPTPDENANDPHRTAHDEAADEAAIAAQLGQDAMRGSGEQLLDDAMEVDAVGSNGQPLTPPRSEKNLLNPLGNGGIPWYLEYFDIDGTTVHEERYTGREVLREMSEELSELDDDVLDGMEDSDPVRPSDAPVSGSSAAKRVRKKQKRSRGW